MPSPSPRRFMRTELRPMAQAAEPGLRQPLDTDVPGLAELMLRAYRGTIDHEGEGLPECRDEIEKTFRGEYGAFVPVCSRVWDEGGALRSAVLVTRWEDRPFVAFTMTDGAATRRGLARRCMRSAMAALQQAGERELRLVVTLANEPAVRLYRSLGFEIEG